MSKDIIILAIESSCDDTSAAIMKNGKICSNVMNSQEIHQKYGGVVPELASRAHQQNIVPVVEAAINEANIDKKDISAVAYTQGPGLLGSLLVGSSFAKGLAMSLEVPTIAVNHMRAHILAHFIQKEGENKETPIFPFLCLTVSGGHTQMVKVNAYDNMQILGETLDDAVGEAFDKVAKMLGFAYPGGPLIDKHAKGGDINKYKFSFPKTGDLEFSFSGLKTQFYNFLAKNIKSNPSFIDENLSDICASIQHHLVEILIRKITKTIEYTGINQVAIAGGVSANSYLRNYLIKMQEQKGWKVFIPAFEYCTDNAAMIAMTAHFKYLDDKFADLNAVPKARMSLSI